MKPFVIIRKYRKEDDYLCQEVIKNFIVSGAKEAFLTCLFKEITLQLIILCWAISFIFIGIPLHYGALTAPGVVLILYLCVYGTYFSKAVELSNANPKHCWVAELYIQGYTEPEYFDIFLKENDMSTLLQTSRMRRKIIGTVSMKSHHSLHNSAFIFRLAFGSSKYLDKIGEALINQTLKYCYEKNYYSAEVVTKECDEEVRDLYIKAGFNLRQVYHKSIIGNSLKVMKAQLGIDLEKWSNTIKTRA